ncbi:hypothetical protein cyc_03074 [Cyclospora cayetanensis]|uniref:Uncharacterized protein n=1 Tax=Cyclospora cayetanensis TaxID=88456 RepID=A0A1D3D5H8_9EIME|nr:hypothetical protein cyc_03074 [Cyclospora cayetanensis]
MGITLQLDAAAAVGTVQQAMPAASAEDSSEAHRTRLRRLRASGIEGSCEIPKESSVTPPKTEGPLSRHDMVTAWVKERMVRSSDVTGGWVPAWTPFRPPSKPSAENPGGDPSVAAPSVGYSVPYKFRVEDNCIAEEKRAQRLHPLNRPSSSFLNYTDFSGNRLPILDTSENRRYWRDVGLDRLLPRVFPLRLPAHRRIDPLLREFIFSLSQMDPKRFNVKALAIRYGLREATVEKIIREFSLAEFLRKNSLATPSTRRVSRAEAVLTMKEIVFKQKLGYEQMGTEEIDSQEENKFEGWKSTFDWVMRQHIEVESMSAFPLPAKRAHEALCVYRDPVPKRVDVDLIVQNSANLKVISWIDPNEKVVF